MEVMLLHYAHIGGSVDSLPQVPHEDGRYAEAIERPAKALLRMMEKTMSQTLEKQKSRTEKKMSEVLDIVKRCAGTDEVTQLVAQLRLQISQTAPLQSFEEMTDKVRELQKGVERIAYDVSTSIQAVEETKPNDEVIREAVKEVMNSIVSGEETRDKQLDGWLLMQKADRSYCEALVQHLSTEVGEHLDRIEIKVVGALRERLEALDSRIDDCAIRAEFRQLNDALKVLKRDAASTAEWDRGARTLQPRACDRTRGATTAREIATTPPMPPLGGVGRLWVPDSTTEQLARWQQSRGGSRGSMDSAMAGKGRVSECSAFSSSREELKRAKGGASLSQSRGGATRPSRPASDRPKTTPRAHQSQVS